jgi:hypothetical protein
MNKEKCGRNQETWAASFPALLNCLLSGLA